MTLSGPRWDWHLSKPVQQPREPTGRPSAATPAQCYPERAVLRSSPRLAATSLLALSRARQIGVARMNLKIITPALAVALAAFVVVGTAAPRGIRYFAPRMGPVVEAALTALPPSAKPLLMLSLDGGYWVHRAPCWAGLMPITIVYDSGAVITLPPKRPWVRGQLGARELDQLRELATRTDLRQYVGKNLTA